MNIKSLTFIFFFSLEIDIHSMEVTHNTHAQAQAHNILLFYVSFRSVSQFVKFNNRWKVNTMWVRLYNRQDFVAAIIGIEFAWALPQTHNTNDKLIVLPFFRKFFWLLLWFPFLLFPFLSRILKWKSLRRQWQRRHCLLC